jgi:broad specificity phosphatase PhoE
VTRLYLVRHSAVTVRPERPAPQWHLSPEGRAAADRLAEQPYWAGMRGLHTSPEPKAVATAQRIAARHGLPLRIERDLREVERRVWVDSGYREQVRRYLAAEQIDGWEPRDAARDRVRACIDALAGRHAGLEAGIVSHGLVLTLYLAGLLSLDGAAAYELWGRIRFPDMAVVDAEARRVERTFGDQAGRRR